MAELAVYPLSGGCIDTPPPNSLVFLYRIRVDIDLISLCQCMRMEVGIFENHNFQIRRDI